MPQYDVWSHEEPNCGWCAIPGKTPEVGSAHEPQGKPHAGLAGFLSNLYHNPVTGYPVTRGESENVTGSLGKGPATPSAAGKLSENADLPLPAF
jgi:hypothetical protein